MPAIVAIRDPEKQDFNLLKEEHYSWLEHNATDYSISTAAITFLHDEDAMAFMLRFNFRCATHNPELLNRRRS